MCKKRITTFLLALVVACTCCLTSNTLKVSAGNNTAPAVTAVEITKLPDDTTFTSPCLPAYDGMKVLISYADDTTTEYPVGENTAETCDSIASYSYNSYQTYTEENGYSDIDGIAIWLPSRYGVGSEVLLVDSSSSELKITYARGGDVSTIQGTVSNPFTIDTSNDEKTLSNVEFTGFTIPEYSTWDDLDDYFSEYEFENTTIKLNYSDGTSSIAHPCYAIKNGFGDGDENGYVCSSFGYTIVTNLGLIDCDIDCRGTLEDDKLNLKAMEASFYKTGPEGYEERALGCPVSLYTSSTAPIAVKDIKSDIKSGAAAAIEAKEEGALRPNSLLYVGEVTDFSDGTSKESLQSKFALINDDKLMPDSKLLSVFDIKLFEINPIGSDEDVTEYEPSGKIKVTIPVPKDILDNYDNLTLVHFKDDGSTEIITLAVDKEFGTASFETDSLSYYAFAGTVKTEDKAKEEETKTTGTTETKVEEVANTSDNTNIAEGVATLTVAGIGFVVLKKKQRAE